MSGCTKILRPGLEWSVGQIKGRPFNVQAKGGHWPTRAFYAECAQVGAGRKVRNADFILIAAKRRYLTLSVSEHNPSTQPAAVRRAPFLFCREAATTTLSGEAAVKPKNPWARRAHQS